VSSGSNPSPTPMCSRRLTRQAQTVLLQLRNRTASDVGDGTAHRQELSRKKASLARVSARISFLARPFLVCGSLAPRSGVLRLFSSSDMSSNSSTVAARSRRWSAAIDRSDNCCVVTAACSDSAAAPVQGRRLQQRRLQQRSSSSTASPALDRLRNPIATPPSQAGSEFNAQPESKQC
jgi:hypothetical protein